MPLKAPERRRLRALAHPLKPVVMIGESGLRESLLAELAGALAHHELIKVRLPAIERDARRVLAEETAAQSGAELVQVLGRIAVLYKRRPREEPKPERSPAPKKRAPRRS